VSTTDLAQGGATTQVLGTIYLSPSHCIPGPDGCLQLQPGTYQAGDSKFVYDPSIFNPVLASGDGASAPADTAPVAIAIAPNPDPVPSTTPVNADTAPVAIAIAPNPDPVPPATQVNVAPVNMAPVNVAQDDPGAAQAVPPPDMVAYAPMGDFSAGF
jgi:hypothetical protein